MRRGVPVRRDRRPPGDDGLRPAGRAARRRARGPPRRLARRARRPRALHPAWQEEITGVDAGAGHPHRARVRPQRRAHQRPLDDRDGRRHQPLVPLRPDLPGHARAWSCCAAARASTAAAGRTTSARRRCGRSPASPRWPSRSTGAGRRATRRRRRSGTWPPSSTATRRSRPTSWRRPSARGSWRAPTSPTSTPRPRGWAGCRPIRASTATRWTSRRRPRREGIPPADYVVRELKAGTLRFAAEDPGAPESFPRVLTLWRSNLFGSSSKGHEHFLKHLLGVTTSADPRRGVAARAAAQGGRVARRGGRGQARPAGHARLPHERLVPALGRRAAGGHLVREARHLEHGPAPVRARVHPAIGPPWETRTDWDIFVRLAESFSRLAERHLGVRTDLVAAPLLHDTPDELAQIAAPGARLEARRVRADPGPDDAQADPGGARLPGAARAHDRARPAGRDGGHRAGRASRGRPTARSRSSACATAACAAARPTGGRGWSGPTRRARRSSRCRAPPTGAWRWRASARWRSAPATRSPTSPRSTPRPGSPTRTPRSSRAR